MLARSKNNGAAGDLCDFGGGRSESEENVRHEMEKPRGGDGAKGAVGNGVVAGDASAKRRGCCWSIMMFLLGLFFVAVATGFSLLWIYTGGRLDQRSVERALPVIRRDVDAAFLTVGEKAEDFYKDGSETLGPYVKKAQEQGGN